MSIAVAQTAPTPNNAQELLRQQERERALRSRQEGAPDARLERPVRAGAVQLPEHESPCFRIDRIVLVGDAADRF
ncbi:MAG TPA: ShlB/FhaC/HecB family hemolysin secretion/activation protein, partial [Trinickia sp.]|nr:ShlB/FhaC/HecB family hemolysin secretion/activation protein [Trinickia sp.]